MAAAKKDAIALLKADHRKVEDLFERFEKARGADRKKALAKEICQELSIHATIGDFLSSLQGPGRRGSPERILRRA